MVSFLPLPQCLPLPPLAHGSGRAKTEVARAARERMIEVFIVICSKGQVSVDGIEQERICRFGCYDDWMENEYCYERYIILVREGARYLCRWTRTHDV